MALEELVIVNPVGSKRRTTTKRKVKSMARRKVSRRSTTARRKAPARRTTTRRKTTTRRRKAPARRTTTRRKAAPKRRTTTRRKAAPKRRTTTRRKTTTRRRRSPARKTTTRRRKSPARRRATRRKTTTRRRKSPARRRATRRKTTTRRRRSPARKTTTRRKGKKGGRRRRASRRTVSRRRTVRAGKVGGFFGKGWNWTRQHLMKFETMVALGAGLYLSASLPAYVEAALSKVGLSIGLTTTPMRSAVSSLVVAGFTGYALKNYLNLSNATAGAFTIAAMLPAALQLGRAAGLSFLPSISVSGGALTAVNGIAGFGLLGNAPSVIDEPMFGMTHAGMHAGVHMPSYGGSYSGEMFGLGGKDINLF
jgi:hypothetical protein